MMMMGRWARPTLTYMYLYMYMYIHVYIYTYIHTHGRTVPGPVKDPASMEDKDTEPQLSCYTCIYMYTHSHILCKAYQYGT